MEYWNGLPLIDDGTPDGHDFLHPVDKGKGLIPRDYAASPVEMFDPPSGIPPIDKSEWSDRIKDLDRYESSLKHIRLTGNNGQPIPSLDQGQQGYCWAHSSTHATMMQRAAAHQPYVPLSAYAVACKIKNFKNEGGWCGLSAKFARETGIPSQAVWPQGNKDRSRDNATTWADAAKHRITEDWVDLTRDVYDQNLAFNMLAACLLCGIPCPVDFNWWSHSVCALNLVEVESGSFGVLILNSWSDQWGDRGMGVLRGQKAIPAGALAVRSTTISVS